ncbi:Holliday junction ATP-dependent DNA helicase RuvA [Thalassocella blandensis]|nr:Holliday junction ATP-dependent DNA helicase RuvA [Thalassocella blandensis]
MIGRLFGKVLEKQAPYLLIDVHGVGYEVQAPMTTFYRLPEVGGEVVLHTHFAVSEVSQQLYGFVSSQDRQLFRLLIKVNGVGPKMAIGIMSMESNDFVRCVMDDNITALVKVPGVGKKTAERLMIEMRDKLKDWNVPRASVEGDVITLDDSGPSAVTGNQIIQEAESALIALGYKPTEAAKAVSAAMNEDITRSEELIRAALKSMLPA